MELSGSDMRAVEFICFPNELPTIRALKERTWSELRLGICKDSPIVTSAYLQY